MGYTTISWASIDAWNNVTLEFIPNEDLGGLAIWRSLPFILVSSHENEMRVVWNGVEYECVMSVFSPKDYVFGNASLYDPEAENTGEPFAFFQGTDDTGSTSAMWIAQEPGTVTLTARIKGKNTYKINQKFIPAMDSLTLVSPDGTRYKVTVDDSGNLAATAT